MQIGIIGAGKIGGTMGRLWAKAGHKVRFATRHPDELKELAEEIGDNASIGTSEEAAWFGEVVFVAVPFGAWPALAKEIGHEIEGKIVADAGNLYPARDGKIAEDAIKAGGSGVYLKTLLPGERRACLQLGQFQGLGIRSTPIRRAVGHDDCRRREEGCRDCCRAGSRCWIRARRGRGAS